MLESQVIAAPLLASMAPTETLAEDDRDEVAGSLDTEFTDDYKGIN